MIILYQNRSKTIIDDYKLTFPFAFYLFPNIIYKIPVGGSFIYKHFFYLTRGYMCNTISFIKNYNF